MGFFIWIREGVRRAVLLGFSDAISEIGQRHAGEDLGDHLATSIRESLAVSDGLSAEGAKPTLTAATATLAAPAGRKRLGKSLEQIRSEKAA